MVTTAKTRKETPAHLRALVERVVEAAADPKYAQRKQMWTRHHHLEKVAKPPVYVGIYVKPGNYPFVWQELIPPETVVSRDPLERDIELQLRQMLYKHDHIPDDDVLLPSVYVKAVRPGARTAPVPAGSDGEHGDSDRAAELWGLPFKLHETDHPGGAYKVDPVLASEADFGRLHYPRHQVDRDATRSLWERATELVEGRLAVKVATNEVGYCPSETVVSLMGIEAVLFGVIDRPDFIHQAMEFATEGMIAYHRAREAAGDVDAEESWYYRAHYEELPPGADPLRLVNTWATISAQSLCGLSPDMYAEFLQPYHARLAQLFGNHRVYYHACEDITRKLSIIRQLPNLGRVHISPWSDLETAVKLLDRLVVLETEAHTADTIFVHTPDQMRASLERIMAIAGECVLDINLIAIETVDGDPSVLTTWAQIAQEVTARHA